MKNRTNSTRTILIGTGAALIVLAVVIAAASLWESFGGAAARLQRLTVPGFQQVELGEAGLYGAVYQHRGPGPMPAAALARLDVRIMSKTTYEDVPVLMNRTGQTFDRFGVRGMPVFNFVAQAPGVYTVTATYPRDVEGPDATLMLISQAAQNVRQTLTVGAIFFVVFLALGIVILVRLDRWAPKAG